MLPEIVAAGNAAARVDAADVTRAPRRGRTSRMRRFAIEAATAEARAAFVAAGCRPPPFADWGPVDRVAAADSHAARAGLGWDVTDAGGAPDRTRGAPAPCDGMLRLRRGECVAPTPDNRPAFRAKGGPVAIGEVSSVNDDRADNLFETPVPRSPAIEEDAPARTAPVCERAPA